MRRVRVEFRYVGTNPDVGNRYGSVFYIVGSNNIQMGVAKAQNELWKDLHVRSGVLREMAMSQHTHRYDFKVCGANFIPG